MAVLRANREFRIFFVTSIVSNAGSFMQGLGVPFVLYGLTHSNAWVGASGFASLIPAVIVSPIVGPLSDRMDRRRILLWSNIVQAIVALTFLVMFAIPLASFGFVLVAMALALKYPRSGIGLVIGGSLVIFLGFYILDRKSVV